ncbi:hypothetical protein, partial [Actinotalea ferrariae]|uniref:hypothetical protein n=1 Tax=Actinotalea ferrariae TaxID=1386098 RepID=UPI00054FE8CA
DPAGAARLADLDPALAAALAVSAWAPWQVLLGAAGTQDDGAKGGGTVDDGGLRRPLRGSWLLSSVPLGTTYLVAHWAPA